MRVPSVRPLVLVPLVLAVACACVATIAWADSDCVPRPPTAAESQSFAAARAAFLASAPAAPDGWIHRDEPSESTPPDLCDDPSRPARSWSFIRRYQIAPETQQARQEAAMARLQQSMAKQRESAEANQARIAEIDARFEVLIQKQIELATAQRVDEVGPINEEMERLSQEKTALMGFGQMDAENATAAAAADHDASATYRVTTAANGSERESFEPFDAPAGEGFRQRYDSGGNAKEDVAIFFGAKSPATNTYPVMVALEGDPERVAALLAAAKLAPVAALAK